MNIQTLIIWTTRASLLGGGIGLLLAGFGRVFAPADIFAHFTPQFTAVLFTGCLAQIIKARAGLILTLGAVFTLGLHPAIAAWTNGGKSAHAAANIHGTQPGRPRALKIISLNSWHSHPRPENIVAFIRQHNPDLVVLLEFGPNKRNILKVLQRDFPHSSDCADRWYCSVAVLSKLPLSAHGSGGPETSIPAHAWMTVNHDGRPFTIIGTHLHRPIDGMNRHRRQMVGLSKLAMKFSGAVLVAGDFNTTRWADSYRLFRNKSGLTPMAHYLPSWPARFPQLAIDHIFHNDHVTLVGSKTGDGLGSDHLPLHATITLK